jgi:hypothetical protein
MKSIFSFIFALSALPALAGIEPGTYLGSSADGQPCSMLAKETYFLGGVRHPLNERVDVELNGQAFVLQHPAVISVEESLASFNHDAFESVLPTSEGAQALIVNMMHSEDDSGPIAFQHIAHKWRADERVKLECNGLQLQPAQP